MSIENKLLENISGKNPDYMAPFLWLHWENDESIVREIERIYETGIRAICIESRTHDDFCGDGWWEDVELILKECEKRDMKLWILDDKYFPSGYANGAFETKFKHLQKWNITEKHVDVAGPVKDACVMSETWRWVPEEDEIVGIYACKRVPNSLELTDEIIDITGNQKDGLVYFDLPEGVFRIVFLVKTRFYMTEKDLRYSDKLNPAATDVYINEVHQKHYDRFEKYFGNTFLGFFADEPGFGNSGKRGSKIMPGVMLESYPWTTEVVSRLEKKHGVEAKKMLVGLWYDIEGISDVIRTDYMNTITDMYSEYFCKRIADWCHEHGVMYIGHVIEDNNMHAATGWGAGHYFKALRYQDMSGIDVVLHQLVPGMTEHSVCGATSYTVPDHVFFNYILAKLASSAAHLEENKQGRAMCEIFGAYGWAEDTKIMKWLADHMMVRGINFFVPHAFSPKENDMDCPPNFYASGINPQYKYFKDVIAYMDRTLNILREGVHKASCLVLYDAEAMWTGKKFCDDQFVAKNLYDNQIDYDLIPADYLDLVDEKNGNAVINGEEFKAVIIPYAEFLPKETMNKLQALLDKGIRLIFADGISVYMRNVLKFVDAPEEVAVESLAEYLRKVDCDDVIIECGDTYLRFLHRKTAKNDIYFFVNESIDHTIDTKITLKDFERGEYAVYDALNNVAVKKRTENNKIDISIPSYQAVFVITGDIPDKLMFEEKFKFNFSEKYNGGYCVSLARAEDMENFEFYKEMDEPESVTGRNGITDFSGDIKYEFEVTSQKADKCILSLGKVGGAVMAWVNGKNVGRRIVPPFKFDITDAITEGKNKIEIIVSNHLGYKMQDVFSRYLMFEPSGITEVPEIEYYSKLSED